MIRFQKAFFFFVLIILTAQPVRAIYDPLSVPNNKFGIHIIDENDLVNASALVNSSGGDWGYVTIVLPQNELKVAKWNALFATMQKLHLIPIIRLATEVMNGIWKQPTVDEASKWADFLSSLNWPVKNRYVILFNEPNHAKEWGGVINPQGYADILDTFSKTLKERSSDFFILPAGLDTTAADSAETMDSSTYISRMVLAKPNVLDTIDGWTSHAYPNPGFTGMVSDRGRKSLRSYEWELTILKKLGVNKNLPVFITETGWPHANSPIDSRYFSPDDVSQFIQDAAQAIWSDSRIAAVTPFMLNYQSEPFLEFSWQKPRSEDFYPQFDSYRSLVKVKGEPQLNQSIEPSPQIEALVAGIETVQPKSSSLITQVIELIIHLKQSFSYIFARS